MAKRQGSILSFFGNANGPTQQKTTKSYKIKQLLDIV
jgi:hypothetical protein